MAVLSLPLSFNNSFWTQDYRKGLEVLFAKLEQVCCYVACCIEVQGVNSHPKGIVENEEVIGFVRVSLAVKEF